VIVAAGLGSLEAQTLSSVQTYSMPRLPKKLQANADRATDAVHVAFLSPSAGVESGYERKDKDGPSQRMTSNDPLLKTLERLYGNIIVALDFNSTRYKIRSGRAW
jgi:hypothetical protein